MNTPNDVAVSVITDEPANATPSVAPVPAGPTEDNNAANTIDNDTADTNNDTSNTDQGVDNSINTPVTIAAPIVTSSISAANVDSKSTPAAPGSAGANTSGAASLTISLLFGIIINLL